MTHEQFLGLCRQHPYYKGRWGYYSAAMQILRRVGSPNVLEGGAAAVPLVPGSQVMQRPGASACVRGEHPATYLWDAGQTPWPIGGKRYDAVVALQVMEHLGDRQAAVFREMRRVARFAVLSFPYRWQTPNDPVHHDIDDTTIVRWTLNHPMTDRLVVPDDDAPRMMRLVCSFAFGE